MLSRPAYVPRRLVSYGTRLRAVQLNRRMHPCGEARCACSTDLRGKNVRIFSIPSLSAPPATSTRNEVVAGVSHASRVILRESLEDVRPGRDKPARDVGVVARGSSQEQMSPRQQKRQQEPLSKQGQPPHEQHYQQRQRSRRQRPLATPRHIPSPTAPISADR